MYIDIKEQRGQYWLENIMKDKFAVSMFGQKRLSREGGIEIVVKELCTRMARDGCQVTCYNRSGHHVSGAEYDNKIEYDGIRQKFVPTIERKGLAAVSSSFFAALYSAFGKYDVVHIHTHFRGSAWSEVAGYQRRACMKKLSECKNLKYPDPTKKVPKKEYNIITSVKNNNTVVI